MTSRFFNQADGMERELSNQVIDSQPETTTTDEEDENDSEHHTEGVASSHHHHRSFWNGCRFEYVIYIDILLILIVITFGTLLVLKNHHHDSNQNPRLTDEQTPATPSPSVILSAPSSTSSFFGDWALTAEIIETNVESFAYQIDLSQDGTVLAVAAPKANNSKGQVQVYRRTTDASLSNGSSLQDSGNIFALTEEEKAVDPPSTNKQQWEKVGSAFLGDEEGDMASLGMDLSLNGRHLAIGYPGNGKGFVRVYTFFVSNGIWLQRGQTLVGPEEGSKFGQAVSLSFDGTFLAIGAPYYGDDENGWVTAFRLVDRTTWVPMSTKPLQGRNPFDLFGYSLIINDSGNVLSVGAPGADSRWRNGGEIQIFHFLEQEQLFPFNECMDGEYPCWAAHGEGSPGGAIDDNFGKQVRGTSNGEVIASSGRVASLLTGDNRVGEVRVWQIPCEAARVYLVDGSETPGKYDSEEFGTQVALHSSGYAFAASTNNRSHKLINDDGRTGVVRVYRAKYQYTGRDGVWDQLSDDIGPFPIKSSPIWYGDGPSVALQGTFDSPALAIGFEALDVDGMDKSVVRIYRWT